MATGSTATTLADYIAEQLNGRDALGYSVSTTGKNVTLSKDGQDVATGSVNDGGKIIWGSVTPTPPPAGNTVQSLAQSGAIKRWDKINYNPGSGTTASLNLPAGASIEGTKLASLNLPSGATLSDAINASSATNWVVLDVDQETGKVLIMPKTVSDVTLTLEGIDGYNNAIDAIDMVAGIYKNDSYAESARGLRVEDINKVMGHTPDGDEDTENWNHRYGMNTTTLDITDAGEGNTQSQYYESTAETGYYYYSIASIFRK